MIGVTKMPCFRRSFASACLVVAIAPLLAQPSINSWNEVAEGVEHTHFTRDAPGGGSWNINALRIDMSRARLDVIRANDVAIGLETVTSIAARTDAIPAVNGG